MARLPLFFESAMQPFAEAQCILSENVSSRGTSSLGKSALREEECASLSKSVWLKKDANSF